MKTRWVVFGAVGIVLGGAALFVLKQYGEYDTRDIPSTLTIIPKAEDGYHIHVNVRFRPTKAIPFICYNPIAGMDVASTHDESMAMESKKILTHRIKRVWPGLCRYRFEAMRITCNKSLTDESGPIMLIRADREGPPLSSQLAIINTTGWPRYYNSHSEISTTVTLKLKLKPDTISFSCSNE